MKLNDCKLTHVIFTNRKTDLLPYCSQKKIKVHITFNAQVILYGNESKYRGMSLNSKQNWNVHVTNKKRELNVKYRKMYWLPG